MNRPSQDIEVTLPAIPRQVVVLLGLFTVAMLVASVVMWFYRPIEASDISPRPMAMRLDVNTVDAAALSALPGIGPQLAERIVEHRGTHGPFNSLNDLQQVPGIGERTLKRLEPYITVSSTPH